MCIRDSYEVDVDLPGLKKDEIDIRLDKGTLTIAAAKGLDKEEDDKNGKFLRRERYTGAMSRSFYIGEGFTVKDIKAKYENCLLYTSIVEKRNSIKAKRAEKLIALVHFETLVVSFDFIKENGMKAFIKKAVHKLQKIDEDYDYPEWQLKTAMSKADIAAQKEAWKTFKFADGKAPLISIAVSYTHLDVYKRQV